MPHYNILHVPGRSGLSNRRLRTDGSNRRIAGQRENVEGRASENVVNGRPVGRMQSVRPPKTKRRRRYAARRQRKGIFHSARLNIVRTQITATSRDQRSVAIWTRTRTSAVHPTAPKRRRNTILQAEGARHDGLPAPQSISVENLCEHLRQLSLRSLDTLPPSADVDIPFTALLDELCQLMSHLTLAEEPQDACKVQIPTGNERDEGYPPPQEASHRSSEPDKEDDIYRTNIVDLPRSPALSVPDMELTRTTSTVTNVLNAKIKSDILQSTKSQDALQAPYIGSFLPLLRLNPALISASIWAPAMRRL